MLLWPYMLIWLKAFTVKISQLLLMKYYLWKISPELSWRALWTWTWTRNLESSIIILIIIVSVVIWSWTRGVFLISGGSSVVMLCGVMVRSYSHDVWASGGQIWTAVVEFTLGWTRVVHLSGRGGLQTSEQTSLTRLLAVTDTRNRSRLRNIQARRDRTKESLCLPKPPPRSV